MMRVMLIVLGVSLAFGYSASAANKSISWYDGHCQVSAQFDLSKYPESSITNTTHLLFGSPDPIGPVGPFRSDPEEYKKFDFDKLKEQCTRSTERIKDLSLIAVPGIEGYRHALIDAVNDACDFETIKIRGFVKPQALHQYQRAAACTPLIEPLEGKRDIAAAVRERVEEICKNGPSPDQCRAEQFGNVESPFGKDARVFLLEFGWNNCANRYTLRNAEAMKREQMRTKLQENFRRMFKVTEEVGCRIGEVAQNAAPPSNPIVPLKNSCPSPDFAQFFEEFLTSALVQKRFTAAPLTYRHVDSSQLETDAQFKSETIESFQKVPITFGSGAARRIVPNRTEMSEERIHFDIKYGADGRSRQSLARVSFYREESDSFSVDYFFFRTRSCWLLRRIVDNSL
jgi:hypothetical protein